LLVLAENISAQLREATS